MSGTPSSGQALLLRLAAPMVSFGGVVVDRHYPTLRYPIRSFFTGLMGNALGLDRTDYAELEDLQAAFSFASRWDVEPTLLCDYQTVDLGSPKMARKAWKSDFTVAGRAGGHSTGTHPTERWYWTDGVLTATVFFAEAARAAAIAHALRWPARPVFYGRKCCIPSAPVLRAVVPATNVTQALLAAPLLAKDAERRRAGPATTVLLETDLPQTAAAHTTLATDLVTTAEVPAGMDMRNRRHGGSERRLRAMLAYAVPAAGAMEAAA